MGVSLCYDCRMEICRWVLTSAEIVIEVHWQTTYWNQGLFEVIFEFVHNPYGIKKVSNRRNIRSQIHFIVVLWAISALITQEKRISPYSIIIKFQISYDIEIRIANLFCEKHLYIVHFLQGVFATTLTRFCLFLSTYPPAYFLWYGRWQKLDIFGPPVNINTIYLLSLSYCLLSKFAFCLKKT